MSIEADNFQKKEPQPWYREVLSLRRIQRRDKPSTSLLQLKNIFDQIDINGNGIITLDDVKAAILKSNVHSGTAALLSEEAASRMMVVSGVSPSQQMDFNTFVHLAKSLGPLNQPKLDQFLLHWAGAGVQRSAVASSTPISPSSVSAGSSSTLVLTPDQASLTLAGAKTEISWKEKYAETIKVFKHLTAGGIAGAVSRTAVSPLERMKILYQVQVPGGIEPHKYKGVFSTLSTIAREEGLLGYFKGNGTNVIRIIPYSAIQFASYERYKRILLKSHEIDLDTYRRLLAGAMAGVTSVVFTYPLDLVRTRLSVQTIEKRYLGVVHCTKIIYKEEGGVRALFRGLSPTVLGIAPYVALNFTVYETLRGWFKSHYGEPSVFQKLLSGALSGCCAQTATYPLDVVRRRMQMVGSKDVHYKYTGTWSAISSIVKNEGIRGLYKGMLPNILKVAPAISVSFVTYEHVKRLLSSN